ncbi:MAG: hypothetical protein GYA24_06340 [Candidatus Lokiarchaeota archaeon]|nr:hypothetical protein [Candidatus Lokiarchaeota archaeon]
MPSTRRNWRLHGCLDRPLDKNRALTSWKPFSPDGRWVVDDPDDGTLVVRAFDPGRDRHPCDIIKE